jgi:ribosomal protein S18 acetylase RimI-like enzyme
MQTTYAEFSGNNKIAHLAETVEQYFSSETPLWWVRQNLRSSAFGLLPSPIACLWMGTAVDQLEGDRCAHIFLLYVAPEHRRQGIGATLMQLAENWARQRGDRQIGLQVFQVNQPALHLYESLGYQVQSLGMSKQL